MAPDSQNRVANRREIMGVVMLALTTLLFLALITDGYEGESRRSLTGIMEVPNFLRSGGALIAGLLSVFLGPASHALYFLTCVWGIMLVRHKPLDRLPMRLLGMFVLAGSLSGLLHVDMAGHTDNTAPGGAFGAFMGDFLQQSFGVVGANVIAVTLVLVGVLLSTEFLFLHAFEMLRGVAAMALRSNTALFRGLSRVWAARQIRIRSSRPRLKGTAVRNLETLPELVEEPETVPIIPVEAAPKTPLAKTNLPVTPVAVPETPKPSADDLSRIVIRTAAPVRRSEELPPPRVHILPAQQDLPLDAPVKPAIPVASDPEIEALLRETRALLEQEKEVEVDISALVEAAGFDDEDEEYEEDGEEEMVDEAEEQAEEEEFEEEIVDETPFEAVATPSISEDAHYTPFQVVAGAGDEEMDEEPATVEPVQEEFPEVAASAPDVFGAKSAKPKKPRFRIKSSDDEELPPNYEYPKFYTCPSIEIFDPAPEQAATDVTDLLRQTSVKIEETFKTFNIEARVTEVLRGPTITRFELQPAPGIKVSRFLALTDDIALSLKAQGVRIEAPIPGKGRVGIE
ncbi:MAG: segregation ATPase FtsK/SpoIIIE, family, partial [Candidatus Hydrogenedentes bacterium]|nr:segregation ATPase FtsK/SpoIIIE, family [Candidatus Hydrogenedentota bacterium]